jgi:hypothetical protein
MKKFNNIIHIGLPNIILEYSEIDCVHDVLNHSKTMSYNPNSRPPYILRQIAA